MGECAVHAVDGERCMQGGVARSGLKCEETMGPRTLSVAKSLIRSVFDYKKLMTRREYLAVSRDLGCLASYEKMMTRREYLIVSRDLDNRSKLMKLLAFNKAERVVWGNMANCISRIQTLHSHVLILSICEYEKKLRMWTQRRSFKLLVPRFKLRTNV